MSRVARGGRGRSRLVIGQLVLLAMLLPALPASGADGDIRIIRDQYGVPHVYGDTAEDVSFGAGYALATDRLWQMHVFRRVAKGRLSDLLGPLVIDIDKEIRFFTYTAEERAARFATYPPDIRSNLQAFADGINRRIDEVKADPTLVPFEFAEWGVPLALLENWTVDDSVALSDVLILSFGSGGGNELQYAALLKTLVDRFGEAGGLARFNDLILTSDPDATPTVPSGYDYASEPDFVRDAEAQARRGLTDDARLSPIDVTPDVRMSLPSKRPAATRGTLEQLALIPDLKPALEGYERLERGRKALERAFKFGSNAQIAGPQLSETGNSIQTGGPQVGYLLPQWLADFGLHSADGKLDATGMTFAGAGPAVLIGRGKGYAWTTTTGASDLTDTYVEQLGPTPRSYVFNGAVEQMACRTETYEFRGVPFDSQEICRTRHGPVFAFDEGNGVAYSLRYAWFNREGQTVEGFFRYNEAQSVEDFATFANYLSSNHNMFYTDDQGNYGFWHPGNHPVRAPGIDIRLPQDGTGTSEWQGLMPIQQVPHAVNFERGWLANWNNQPAEGWGRERGHPALDNVNDLERTLDPAAAPVPDPDGGLVNPDRLLDFEDMSANLRYAAFKHHRDTYFREFLPGEADLADDIALEALRVVNGWDGFVNDPDGDGLYDAGKTVIDRWVSLMVREAFADDLGDLRSFGNESLLWHLLKTDDALSLNVDWLNGETPDDFAARVFEAAVGQLAGERDGGPENWRDPVALEHYQRLNADLFTDVALGEAGLGNKTDSGVPGDVRDHIRMDRGTYNHVVSYQTPPTGSGVLGEAAVKAGSVIPPGQSGWVTIGGTEAPHYEDQLELYEEWRYKPMPMTLEESQALAESAIVLER